MHSLLYVCINKFSSRDDANDLIDQYSWATRHLNITLKSLGNMKDKERYQLVSNLLEITPIESTKQLTVAQALGLAQFIKGSAGEQHAIRELQLLRGEPEVHEDSLAITCENVHPFVARLFENIGSTIPIAEDDELITRLVNCLATEASEFFGTGTDQELYIFDESAFYTFVCLMGTVAIHAHRNASHAGY